MSKEIEWIVQTGDARLDKLVAEELPELTRSAVQNLISQGLVFCNGEPVLKSARPVRGDRITVRFRSPKFWMLRRRIFPWKLYMKMQTCW